MLRLPVTRQLTWLTDEALSSDRFISKIDSNVEIIDSQSDMSGPQSEADRAMTSPPLLLGFLGWFKVFHQRLDRGCMPI